MSKTLDNFSKIINYQFKKKSLLIEALTHPSLTINQHKKNHETINYERLEFLGDIILSFVITEILIAKFPQEKEGELAKRRSVMISGKTLTEIGKKINIGDFLLMSYGEESIGGRSNKNNIENAVESLIAAIYLDGGIMKTKKFIKELWTPLINENITPPKDPKSELQEYSQEKYNKLPKYEVIATTGKDHNPTFKIKVSIAGIGAKIAEGSSKKEGQTKAAIAMLKNIKNAKN